MTLHFFSQRSTIGSVDMQCAKFFLKAFVVLSCCFCWPVGRLVTGQDGPGQVGPFEATPDNISRSLKVFENLACGLQFEQSLIRNGKPWRKVRISISDDGGIRKSFSEGTDLSGHLIRTGSYSNRSEGWCFNTNASPTAPIDPEDPDVRKPRSCIEFSALGQDAGTQGGGSGGNCFFGFFTNKSFSKFLEESETTNVVNVFNHISYQGVRCDHPTQATLTIYFDDRGRVVWIKSEALPGDLEPGSKFLPDRLVPTNSSSVILYGPLEYQTFEGREVLKNCAAKVSAKNPEPIVAYSRHEFTNYRKLTDELTRKISLPEFELVDGSSVTCIGNPSITCEYRDGEVVIIVDGKSVEAAKRARFSRSSGGWLRFYSICGFGFALVFGFLVWYRNRGG